MGEEVRGVGHFGGRTARPRTCHAQPPALAPPQAGPWWFTVKYGEDQQALFNMDCWACTLIDHVKDKCGYQKLPEKVDLQKEGGGMMDMPSIPKQTTAKGTLEPKATYFLCKLVVPEEGGAATPEMLWTPPEGYVPPAAAAGGKAPPKKK